jgi:hypothetical protein
VSIFGRWHKEIFADLAAVLLGGPAVAWGMAEFLSHPSDKVMTYRPGGPHPTGYLRVLILAELVRRMGFGDEAARLSRVWRALYDPARGHRIPSVLLQEAPRAIPAVVDEVVYQARRNCRATAAGVSCKETEGRGASALSGLPSFSNCSAQYWTLMPARRQMYS